MAERTIAIGDIHGCRDALAALIDAIEPQPDDTLITLGDYPERCSIWASWFASTPIAPTGVG